MISSHVDHLTDIAFSNQNCNLVHLRSIQAALLKEKKKEGRKMSNDLIIFSEVFTSNLIMKIKANGMVLIKWSEKRG